MLFIAAVRRRGAPSWLVFLQTIRSHGAADMRIVVSDAHLGLVCTIGEILRRLAWKRHGGAEGGKPDTLANLIFPPTNMKRLHTNIV